MKQTIALLSILLLATPCFAGVVFEIEVTDYEKSTPKTESSEVTIEDPNLKMNIQSSEDGRNRGEMIYRGDRREMVIVNHNEKAYYVIDKSAMDSIGAQAKQAEAMMQQALANMPEDRRAMIEQMMKQKMPQGAQMPGQRPKSVLKKTNERATHHGYPCVKYEVWRDDRKIQELWVTKWSNLDIGAEAIGVFEDMSEFFEELLDSVPKFAQNGGSDQPFFEFMQEVDGFPVITKDFDENGSLESESALRSTARHTFHPDDFEPPAGYKAKTMGPQ